MRATLTNLSPKPRDKTILVTFPTVKAQDFPEECTFLTDNKRAFRAVKGTPKGSRHTPFRIFATMDGSEVVEGTLLPEPHRSSHGAYKWHKWTADDITALVPDIGVETQSGAINWTSAVQSINLVETSKAHQRWHLRKLLPSEGLVFEFWVDINHNDPVVDYWGKIVWSDRNNPNPVKVFKSILIKSGEYLTLDFRSLHGADMPVQNTNGWTTVLARNIRIQDGAGLPLSGSMSCFVGPHVMPGHEVDPDNNQDQNNKDFSSLLSSLFGQVAGVSHDWEGQWLANKYIPRRKDLDNLRREEEASWNRFINLQVNRGWYAERPFAIGRSPGITGDQEDFGATKGIYAVSQRSARHILPYRYSVYADLFRGYNHYESTGLPLDVKNHPTWVTWSGVTHWHTGVSQDRLGKSAATVFPEQYVGYDDQHRSQNTAAAYYQLSDDPLVLDQISHHITTDLAMYRYIYPQFSPGAARAQGRLAGAWANFYVLTDGDLKLNIKKLLDSKWDGIKNNPTFSTEHAIPILGGHGPDGRKTIYDESGNLLPSWSVWEHALAAVGLYNAYKADPTHPQAKTLLTRLFQSIVANGCFEADDGWWLIVDMWYRNGEALPEPYSKSNNKILYDRGGVATWVLAAMIGAADFLDQDDPLRAKAVECSKYFTLGEEASNNTDSQWWAVARSVEFTDSQS